MIISYPYVIINFVAQPHIVFESHSYDECETHVKWYCESAKKADYDDDFFNNPEKYYCIVKKEKWLRMQSRPFAGIIAELQNINREQNSKKINI